MFIHVYRFPSFFPFFSSLTRPLPICFLLSILRLSISSSSYLVGLPPPPPVSPPHPFPLVLGPSSPSTPLLFFPPPPDSLLSFIKRASYPGMDSKKYHFTILTGTSFNNFFPFFFTLSHTRFSYCLPNIHRVNCSFCFSTKIFSLFFVSDFKTEHIVFLSFS